MRFGFFVRGAVISIMGCGAGFAQTDEIQVYDGGLSARGVFNLTLHNNFTPKGQRSPGFVGGLPNDKNWNGVAEWAYGVTDWFEMGIYLPLFSESTFRGPSINGGKLRALFAVPHADDRLFFYGANFEFSYNAKHWNERHYTAEIRPIIGWHLKPVDIIFNPILDHSWVGGFKSMTFAPATRVAYNLSPTWAVGVEHYADLGQLRGFSAVGQQSHQIYGVFDHKTKFLDIEAGLGIGVTGSSDKLTLKLLLSRDINNKKTP